MPRQNGSKAQEDLGHVDGPLDRQAHRRTFQAHMTARPAYLQDAQPATVKKAPELKPTVPPPSQRVCEVHKVPLKKVGWLFGAKIYKCTVQGCIYCEPA